MKFMGFLILLTALAGISFADETPSSTPSPSPAAVAPVKTGIPWADWFKSNTLVSDKQEYVHFFFNAQDFKTYYDGKDKALLVAKTAAQMSALLYPQGAAADKIKMDIVFVAERDNYGMPKWDTLTRVAHLEFLRSAVLPKGKPKAAFTPAEIKKIFKPFQIF